jgi:hypothetical protein
MSRSAKPRRAMSHRPSRRLLLEHLEGRTLLHGASAALVGNVLEITGSDVADQVNVVANRDGGTIDVLVPGHAAQSFLADSVASVRILGRAGDDLITLDRALSVPMQIDGGDGVDSVLGWSGPDTTYTSHGLQFAAFAARNSMCVGVECFSLTGGASFDETVRSEDDELALGSSQQAILAAVHEHGIGSDAIGYTFTGAPGYGAATHTAHSGSNLAFGNFGNFDLSGSAGLLAFGSPASHGSATHAVATGQAIGHSQDGMAGSVAAGMAGMIGMSGMRDSAASDENYAFLTRSPYAGKECPTSTPLGATTLSNTLAGPETAGAAAPKIGCG